MIQVQDAQVVIVDVEQDGILIHQGVNHVIHSVEMDMLWVQNNVREEGMDAVMNVHV